MSTSLAMVYCCCWQEYVVLIAVGDRRPLAKVLIAVAALAV
jgi:hypothetical protein